MLDNNVVVHADEKTFHVFSLYFITRISISQVSDSDKNNTLTTLYSNNKTNESMNYEQSMFHGYFDSPS